MSVARLLILVLIGVAACLRFVNLSESPPGFYIDEAAVSAQVICVGQSRANLQGVTWPLFTPVLGGGYATPSYVYPAAAWASVFGTSIASFRAFTAFFSLLFIGGSFLLGRRLWQTEEAGFAAALSASISPWVFQFARIAWDPALAPAYITWAFALLFVTKESRTRRPQLLASGVLFSLAAYCYPPVRVELAITLPLAIVGLWMRTKRTDTWMTVVTAGVMSVPLILKTLSGEIQGRFQMLSIFNPAYQMQTYGNVSLGNGLKSLIANLLSMFSPNFLILHGDANLRHSTGQFGVWSWLDVFAIFAGVCVLVAVVVKRSRKEIAWFEVCFCIVGYLAGLLPAALTWESNPHALRSFGAVSFLVIGAGGLLAMMWRWGRPFKSAIVGVSFTSFLIFVHVYFAEYPRAARIWFDTDVVDLAKQLESENRLNELGEMLASRGVDYDPMAVAYYKLAGGVMRCPVTPSTKSP